MNKSIQYLVEHKDTTYQRYIEFFENLIGNTGDSMHKEKDNNIEKNIGCTFSANATKNILIIAPGRNLPSAHICLKIPLENDLSNNVYLLEEADISNNGPIEDDLEKYLTDRSIDVMFMCRCFGNNAEKMLSRANEMGIPTIYFLDDDLIEPCEIALSPKKFKMHSSPDRTRSIRNLIAAARCVYASTPKLSERLKSYNITNTIVSSKINCSPAHYIDIFKQKTISSTKTIGYMGFGHGADFKVAQFAIKSLMENMNF